MTLFILITHNQNTLLVFFSSKADITSFQNETDGETIMFF